MKAKRQWHLGLVLFFTMLVGVWFDRNTNGAFLSITGFLETWWGGAVLYCSFFISLGTFVDGEAR